MDFTSIINQLRSWGSDLVRGNIGSVSITLPSVNTIVSDVGNGDYFALAQSFFQRRDGTFGDAGTYRDAGKNIGGIYGPKGGSFGGTGGAGGANDPKTKPKKPGKK